MSRFSLEEEEQIAGLKAFWNKYGNPILIALIVVFGSYAAYNGYRWYLGEQSKEAVVAFEKLQKAIDESDLTLVSKIEASLISDHKSSPYVSRGLLLASKAYYEGGKLAEAEKALSWVADNEKLAEYQGVARLNLSSLLAEDGRYDQANALLAGKQYPGFEGLFADRRGDIAFMQKNYSEAKTLYQLAQQKLPADSPWLEVINKKLSAIPAEG